jgi:phospholipid/cholesterol/gamma-HCH transport system substrate-binding protein
MKHNNLETTVGIFLMAGIAVICALIIFFGEVQDMFKPSYEFTVDFPNASGLLKGSDVYLSGASIGKVITDPQPIPDTEGVTVKLKVSDNIKVREDAKFVIGSSGLLGDRYVDVQPVRYPPSTSDELKAKYITDGQEIKGTPSYGIDELTQSAEPLIQRANHIAAQLDDMITRLNTDVLSSTSSDDLKETIAKLRDMVNNGDSMVTNANDILIQMKSGKGTLGLLMNDPKTRSNVRDLIENMKEHGPVFYHDTAAQEGKKN